MAKAPGVLNPGGTGGILEGMKKPAGRRGQTVVEYTLMLSCVVCEIVAMSVFMKEAMPKIFDRIEAMICGLG